MKKHFSLIFLLTIFFGFSFSSCNNSNQKSSENPCDSLCKNYDIVLNANGVIVLKRKPEGTESLTTTASAYTSFVNGQIIDTATARKEIDAYRQKYKDDSKYVDFGFLELLQYFMRLKTPYPDANLHIGIRIYPALSDEGKMTIIFAPTYNSHAIWRQKPATTNASATTTTDTDPFNTGSICPPNCPDENE